MIKTIKPLIIDHDLYNRWQNQIKKSKFFVEIKNNLFITTIYNNIDGFLDKSKFGKYPAQEFISNAVVLPDALIRQFT